MHHISIVSQNVEIKTIALNSKKITKAIFNQIESATCFDSNLDFIGDQYFGYVKDKDLRILIWSVEGKLKRTNLSVYSKLKKLDETDCYTHQDIEWFLRKCKIQFDIYDDERHRSTIELKAADAQQYNLLLDKANTFIVEVLNHQLYI